MAICNDLGSSKTYIRTLGTIDTFLSLYMTASLHHLQDLMRGAPDMTNVVEACNLEGRQERLDELLAQLEMCEKALQVSCLYETGCREAVSTSWYLHVMLRQIQILRYACLSSLAKSEGVHPMDVEAFMRSGIFLSPALFVSFTLHSQVHGCTVRGQLAHNCQILLLPRSTDGDYNLHPRPG